MHPFFLADPYETPAGIPRLLLDRISMGGRWGFYAHYLKVIWNTNQRARQGKLTGQEWAHQSLHIFRDIEQSGGRFFLEGLSHLESVPGPVVIVANHQSTLETMILPCVIQPVRPVTFVVKASLRRGWLLGPIMRARHTIGVERKNPRDDLKKVLEEGVITLKGGRSLAIFPQAHRKDDFDPAEFNSLGVKLALKAGVPLIPLALQTDFWGNGRWIRAMGPIRRHRPIRMAFGAPLLPGGNSKEMHQAVVDFITSHLALWQRQDPPR